MEPQYSVTISKTIQWSFDVHIESPLPKNHTLSCRLADHGREEYPDSDDPFSTGGGYRAAKQKPLSFENGFLQMVCPVGIEPTAFESATQRSIP